VNKGALTHVTSLDYVRASHTSLWRKQLVDIPTPVDPPRLCVRLTHQRYVRLLFMNTVAFHHKVHGGHRLRARVQEAGDLDGSCGALMHALQVALAEEANNHQEISDLVCPWSLAYRVFGPGGRLTRDALAGATPTRPFARIRSGPL